MNLQKYIKSILLFVLLPMFVNAQYKYKKFTYFGLEFGLKGELFDVQETGTELYHNRSFQKGIQGFFVEQELSRHLMIGTGLYFTKYTTDFRFKIDEGFNVFPSMRTMMIPARFVVQIPLFYGIPEVRILPRAGIYSVFNLSNTSHNVRGKIAPDLSNTYEGVINYNLRSVYFLGEAGLNIDMMFAKGTIVSFGGSYTQGLSNIAETQIEYRIGREINSGKVVSKGNFYALQFSTKYPISRWWRKKAKRKK